MDNGFVMFRNKIEFYSSCFGQLCMFNLGIEIMYFGKFKKSILNRFNSLHANVRQSVNKNISLVMIDVKLFYLYSYKKGNLILWRNYLIFFLFLF